MLLNAHDIVFFHSGADVVTGTVFVDIPDIDVVVVADIVSDVL